MASSWCDGGRGDAELECSKMTPQEINQIAQVTDEDVQKQIGQLVLQLHSLQKVVNALMEENARLTTVPQKEPM